LATPASRWAVRIGTFKELKSSHAVKSRSHVELSLRLNKPLQPQDASSMSKALSFSGSNEPAVATVKPSIF
jgi:hypothetical protein